MRAERTPMGVAFASPIMRLAAGALFVAAGTAVVTGICVVFLRPPAAEVLLLTLYLIGSGALSLVVGYAGSAALERTGRGGLRLRLAFSQILAIAVAFINIVGIALLMFISTHDLALLGLLLLFAALMALFFSLALAESIAAGIASVSRAAQRMAAGDLGARAAVASRDEVGGLAEAFNHMAAQLEAAAARQRDAETARRYLVAAVSHDLRTPLASIRAMVEAINDGVVSDQDTVRRYMATLQSEVERLSSLINDLFDLSQIDAGQLRLEIEAGSLHDLISDTLRSLGPQALQRGVHLAGSVDSTLPPVRLDPTRVQRVLDNLVGNALRHTPIGGTVEIRAHERGDAVEVVVQDTGDGITEGDLPHVFEPFFRGDESRSRAGGAGLGLTIARGIVHAHQGRIWAESTRGQGAVFHFTLPRVAGA